MMTGSTTIDRIAISGAQNASMKPVIATMKKPGPRQIDIQILLMVSYILKRDWLDMEKWVQIERAPALRSAPCESATANPSRPLLLGEALPRAAYHGWSVIVSVSFTVSPGLR